MRVLYYTFICLFGTALAMPVHSQQQSADASGGSGSTDGSGLIPDVANGAKDLVSGVAEDII
ncbi:hypothetical protein N7540_004126 [Penicillium herquei]|nr:hypothetical protein N7540_004126 [Penicillium herquei]